MTHRWVPFIAAWGFSKRWGGGSKRNYDVDEVSEAQARPHVPCSRSASALQILVLVTRDARALNRRLKLTGSERLLYDDCCRHAAL